MLQSFWRLSHWFKDLPPRAGESEILRKTAANFLNGVALMDTDLSYTPSQTASTAVLSGASRVGITMKSCLSQSLMLKENRTYLSQLLDIMKSMRTLVKKKWATQIWRSCCSERSWMFLCWVCTLSRRREKVWGWRLCLKETQTRWPVFSEERALMITRWILSDHLKLICQW